MKKQQFFALIFLFALQAPAWAQETPPPAPAPEPAPPEGRAPAARAPAREAPDPVPMPAPAPAPDQTPVPEQAPVPPPPEPPPVQPNGAPPVGVQTPIHPWGSRQWCANLKPGDRWMCQPPRRLAVGAVVLKEYGFGLSIRGRWNHFALEAAAGYQPWFFVLQYTDGRSKWKYKTTGQFTGGVIVFFNSLIKPLQHGLKASYAYNTLVGNGVVAGYILDVSKWKRFVLSFGAGFQIFPQAKKLIDKKMNLPVKVPWSAGIQPYIGFTFNFFLL